MPSFRYSSSRKKSCENTQPAYTVLKACIPLTGAISYHPSMTLIDVPTTHPALRAARELRPLLHAHRSDALAAAGMAPEIRSAMGVLGCFVSLRQPKLVGWRSRWSWRRCWRN